MTFRIWTLFVLFFLLKNRALASESPPDPAPPALVGDNLTRSPANGIVDEDQIIQCFLNEEIPDKVQWFTINQDGIEEELQTNDGLTSIKAENAALKYRCKIDENTYADFVVRKVVTAVDAEEEHSGSDKLPFRVNKFEKSISVVEAEDLRVKCKVSLANNSNIDIGNDLEFKWYMYNVTGDTDTWRPSIGNCSEEKQEGLNWQEVLITRKPGEEPHYNLLEVDGIPNKMIKIEDANRATDRKAFKCVVFLKENRSNCSESAFFVRIRDKYAALWPFIGIVSEVVVICLIIFICERRRAATAKDDLDDDDEDLNGRTGTGTSGNNLRQRGNKSN